MNSFFLNLSSRERRLALLTGGVVAFGLVFMIVLRGVGLLNSLDARVALLEQELVNLTQQEAQKKAVDEAFRQVVAEFSSNMSKEEIHDHLRREIYRHTQAKLPGKEGEPPVDVTLARIPILREGSFREEADGYREYQIQFRVPSALLPFLMAFVQRLETSPQMLRIDSFDLGRAPAGTAVHATFEITRTVLNDPDARSAVSRDAGGDF